MVTRWRSEKRASDRPPQSPSPGPMTSVMWNDDTSSARSSTIRLRSRPSASAIGAPSNQMSR
jgi:hypothetical protein